MTAEESAIKRFSDEPYFEVLVESIARTAAKYAYAKVRHDKTLGAGNRINCTIREQVLNMIQRLDGQS